MKATVSNKELDNSFCPLIQDSCRRDCINFRRASINKWMSNKGYSIFNAYCAYFKSFEEE